MDKTPMKKGKKLLILLSSLFLAIAAITATTIILVAKNQEAIARKAAEEAERQQIINSSTYHEGVTVNGVSISGMTPQEAKEALKPIEEDLIPDTVVTFSYDNRRFKVTADDVNLVYNTDDVLDEAFSLARDGDYESLKTELEDIALNGKEYTITCTIDCSPLKDFIAETAEKINTPPADAAVELNPNLTGSARFIFKESVDGVEVDQKALYELISSNMEQGVSGKVELPATITKAEITAQQLRENLTLRASFHTSYAMSNGSGRVHNIKKAAGMINGTIVNPGEVFSTNDILGYRTHANGWKDGPAIIQGGAATENQPGGGVCQVSTTVYNAVVMADLEIVYRQGHSRVSDYVDGGRDATIDSGRIDFQWKNNTGSPIYVFTWVESSKQQMHCEIYGEPISGKNYDRVDFVSKLIEVIEPSATVYIEKDYLYEPYWKVQNKARKGYIYEAYRVYYKNGVEVDRKRESRTTYKMHPERVHVWPGFIEGTVLLPDYKLK